MIYRYGCPRCRRVFDRLQLLISEKDDQFHTADECDPSGAMAAAGIGPVKLHFILVPTTNRAVVFANDRNTSGGLPVGGPKDKALYLKRRGLIELGNEKPSEMHKMVAGEIRDTARKRTKEIYDDIMEEMRDYSESELFGTEGDDTGEHLPIEEYAKQRREELTGKPAASAPIVGVNTEITTEDIEEVGAIVESSD